MLRAKIDMNHENMQMRDPVMYRIRNQHHFRTGDRWKVYPTYDWAHGQSDAIEGTTHSLCTLEFDSIARSTTGISSSWGRVRIVLARPSSLASTSPTR